MSFQIVLKILFNQKIYGKYKSDVLNHLEWILGGLENPEEGIFNIITESGIKPYSLVRLIEEIKSGKTEVGREYLGFIKRVLGRKKPETVGIEYLRHLGTIPIDQIRKL